MDESTKKKKTRNRVRKHRELERAILIELQNARYSSSSEDSLDPDDRVRDEQLLPQHDCDSSTVHQQHQDTVSEDCLPDEVNLDMGISSEESDPISPPIIENNSPQREPIQDEAELLKEWALDCNIAHVDLDKLLKILRKRLIPNLPLSSKTFLKTCEGDYDIRPMHSKDSNSKGEFVYFGIERGLKLCFNKELHSEKVIELQFNVDGLPLFKSSMQQFWPILCKVHNTVDIYSPFVVAIYSGDSKPPIEEYLQQFIEELSKLQTNGLQIAEEHYDIRTKCFICDTPARSFLKCTKGHGGYSACERCTVYGNRITGTTVYADVNCPERTDESFRNLEDPEHHIDVSPLTFIEPSLDLVKIFLLDFMHLTGVMKRLLDIWLGGSLHIRLGRVAKNELSRRLQSLRSQIPCDFQRKIRSIRLVKFWKATEFRFFLLYCGPIVLKQILPKNLYDHFLLLHVGCRILCDDKLAIPYNKEAKIYLRSFVQMLPVFYGRNSTVMNMHNLIHLADDAKNMGCTLSKITAFPFENLLGKIKKILRTPNRPLAQLCRRLQEKDSIDNTLEKSKASLPRSFTILKESFTNYHGYISVSKIKCNVGVLTPSMPDNVVLLEDGLIVQITNIFYSNNSVNDIRFVGVSWKEQKAVFEYPTNSNDVYTWELKAKPSSNVVRFGIDFIQRKVLMMCSRLNSNGRMRHYASALTHK